MPKLRIVSDEWYPCRSLEEPDDIGETIEVTDEFYARYKRIYREFVTLQSELAKLDGDDD